MPSPPSKAFGSVESEGRGAVSMPFVEVLEAESVVVAGALDVGLAVPEADVVLDCFWEVEDSMPNCRLTSAGSGTGRGSKRISFKRASS